MRRAKPKNESPREEAEGVIEALGHRGEGVVTVRGQSVYVPLTVAGDRVRFAHAGERGELLEVLEGGPARVAAPCVHFGACGGCQLQHVDADTYTSFKVEGLRAALGARGIACEIAPLARVPRASRRRATLAFAHTGNAVTLGFHGGHSHALTGIEGCLVLVPQIVDALAPLREWLAGILPDRATGTLHATACENGLDLDLELERSRLQDNRAIAARLSAGPQGIAVARVTVSGDIAAQHAPPVIAFDGIKVTMPSRAFLQPTVEGEGLLRDWVVEGVGEAKRVCDLFSGLGTFALPLARRAAVHAVDMERAPLDALGAAWRGQTGLKPVTVECRDLMRAPLQVSELKGVGALVFDPPRAGASAQAAQIALSGVPRVVAVSCNPATFARDARILLDAGYRLDWLRPLDQFLFTAHIELVAQFSKAKS